MTWKTSTGERSGVDPRDLRRPESLLGPDSFEPVLSRLPKGASLLDIGGIATGIVDFARRGFVVHIETVALPGGEGRIPEDLAIHLDAADGSHQAVIVPGLFFFLPKRSAGALVTEIHRVLAPGGFGLATFPPIWNPSLLGEALIDAATPDGPDADIVRRGNVSVRYTRYTSREIDSLVRPFSSQQAITQKNGVRRILVRKKP